MNRMGLVVGVAVGFIILVGCTRESTLSPAQSLSVPRAPTQRPTVQARGTRVTASGLPQATPLYRPAPRATYTPFAGARSARPTTRARGLSLQTATATAIAGRGQQFGQPYVPGQQPYQPTQPYPPGQQPYQPTQPYQPGQSPYQPGQPPYQPGPSDQYGQPWQPGTMPYGPGAWVGGLTYVVHTGDTLYNIARRFGVTVEDLAAANGIPYLWYVEVGRVLFVPVPAPLPGPPVPAATVYIVQPGDTLYSISRRFGVPVEVLAVANGIPDLQRIFAGQRLAIPCAPPCQPGPPSPNYVTPGPNPPEYPTPYLETPYPPYPVTDTPTTSPPPSPDTYLYSSVDGKFNVQYPTSWQNGTDNPAGYVVFWSSESNDPFSAGIAVLSKSNPTWRTSQQVMDDYKGALPGLMSGRMGGASFIWDNTSTPVTLGGNLAMADYGYAQTSGSNRDRLWAQAVNVNGRDYLVLTWAPPDLWSAYQAQLTSLAGTVTFLP